MAKNFEFYTGLRGYHVYSNTVGWKPYVQEKIILKREQNMMLKFIKRHPWLQGGFEIPVKVAVTWNEPEKLSVLVAKV